MRLLVAAWLAGFVLPSVWLLSAHVAEAATAPELAALQVYADLSVMSAFDAQLEAGTPPAVRDLARGQRPGDAGTFVAVPPGRATLEVRVAGTGRERLVRRTVHIREGRRYCAYVVRSAGRVRVMVEDVATHSGVGPGFEQICKDLFRGQRSRSEGRGGSSDGGEAPAGDPGDAPGGARDGQ